MKILHLLRYVILIKWRYCDAADPLAVNDDSLTPLHMARSRGHVAVIRMIEVISYEVSCSILRLLYMVVSALKNTTYCGYSNEGVKDIFCSF